MSCSLPKQTMLGGGSRVNASSKRGLDGEPKKDGAKAREEWLR